MTRRSLPEKIVALHSALGGALDKDPHRVAHAFGGAIALAYYAEPRSTIDIDLNVFVPEMRANEVVALIAPLGVTGSLEHVDRDGQVRLWWDDTPVDLFFSYDRFHDAAAEAVRVVPFAEATIPVLSANHLVVCKTIFDRAKDWVDIDAIRDAGTPLDTAEILRWVGRIAGDDDPRYERIAALLTS